MNIFKALSYGDGGQDEKNISGLVAYLLNPTEDHGLGNIFLEGFLSETCRLVNEDKADSEIINNFLSDEYYVEVEPEKNLYKPDDKKVKPDILISIREKADQRLAAIFIIEIKIKASSEDKNYNQLIDQLEAVRHDLKRRGELEDSKIYQTYLVPEKLIYEIKGKKRKQKEKGPIVKLREFIKKNKDIEQQNLQCNYLSWNTFQELLISVINKDSCTEIYPLSPFVLYILKSFKLWLDEEVISKNTLQDRENNSPGITNWQHWIDILIQPRRDRIKDFRSIEQLNAAKFYDNDNENYHRCLLVIGRGPNGGHKSIKLLEYSYQDYVENNSLAEERNFYFYTPQLENQIIQENRHTESKKLIHISNSNHEGEANVIFSVAHTVKNNLIHLVNKILNPEQIAELVSLSQHQDGVRYHINRWTPQGEWNEYDSGSHPGVIADLLFTNLLHDPEVPEEE